MELDLLGVQARDAAFRQVEENNDGWFRLAVVEVEELAKHGSRKWTNWESGFIGEDLRRYLARAIGNPKSPHAYGMLFNYLLKKKVVRKTGEYRCMKEEKSHARASPVYVFCGVSS